MNDTQFAGFAERLLEEILDVDGIYIDTTNPNWREEWQAILAQRAFDLVQHTLMNVEPINLDRLTVEEHTRRIPDLREWPEQ